MRPWESWSLHVSTLLVGGTGLVYAVMRYLMEPTDPFSVVNHPWQPATQHLHVLAAPLLVFACGLVWRHHVWAHFRSGKPQSRRSGLGLLGTLVPMVVSGYLIQTTVTEGWRTTWIVIHLATSGIFLAAYVVHYVVGMDIRRRNRRRRTVAVPVPDVPAV